MTSYLNICAIAKNEGLYLKDWVEYHRAIGVDRIVIYNNGSSDNSASVLNGLRGTRVHQIPGKCKQLEAYNRYMLSYRKDSVWTAFIDIDEYLCPLQCKSLKHFLRPYELCTEVAGVGVQWRLFNSNGLTTYEDKPVIERFTKRMNAVNPHIKCFVKNERVTRTLSPHWFATLGAVVNENFKVLSGSLTSPIIASAELIQCNHYIVKSYEECRKKLELERSDTGEMRDFDTYFNAHNRREGEVDDFRARDLYRELATNEDS